MLSGQENEGSQVDRPSTRFVCCASKSKAYSTIIDFFPKLCTVSADVSQFKKFARPLTNPTNGKKYYQWNFDVILLFGLTELKAQVAWMENVCRTFLS